MSDHLPKQDLKLPPSDEVAGLLQLLDWKDYIRLRARYDAGQLSFYGQITEMERQATGRVLTK